MLELVEVLTQVRTAVRGSGLLVAHPHQYVAPGMQQQSQLVSEVARAKKKAHACSVLAQVAARSAAESAAAAARASRSGAVHHTHRGGIHRQARGKQDECAPLGRWRPRGLRDSIARAVHEFVPKLHVRCYLPRCWRCCASKVSLTVPVRVMFSMFSMFSVIVCTPRGRLARADVSGYCRCPEGCACGTSPCVTDGAAHILPRSHQRWGRRDCGSRRRIS